MKRNTSSTRELNWTQHLHTHCLLAMRRKLVNKSKVTFELLVVGFNFQPVIILRPCEVENRATLVIDDTDHWLLRGTPCFNLHTSCYRLKKKKFIAWLKRKPFLNLSPPLMLFWNMKHSVCVWPLHTTLPILQCDETFVLAWIETLFSYLMLWYKKMFFKQKTLHL